MKEELLTIQQAADFLSVSTKTLRRWEARGVLNPARTVGNQRRYTLTELQEFKAKGKPAFQTAPTTNEIPVVSHENTQPIQTPVQATSIETPLHNSVNQQPFIPAAAFQTTPVQSITQDVPVRTESNKLVQDQVTNVQDRVQVLQQFLARKKVHAFSRYAIAGLIVFTALLMATMYGPVKTASQLNLSKNSSGINVDKQSVLAAETKGRNLIGDVLFNVPAIFEGKVTVENDFVVNGKSLFNEDITVANKNLTLGTGKLTASNVVYGLTAGANVTITGDPQNPTISAGITGGIESFQGQSGVVTLVEGDGVGIDGLTISNTGVLSLAGETGDVELTAGDGIAIDGTTITNDDPGSAQNIFKTILVDATEIIADSNDDTFTITAGSGITLTPDANAKSITINSSVASGLSGLTTYGVLYATSSTEATSTVDGTTGTVLKGVTGGAPVFGAVSLTADVSDVLPIANGGTGLGTTPSNGQLLIGNGTGYTLSTITGTSNQISVNNSAGGIGLSTPQDIHTGAMPTFATLNLTASANQLVLGSGNTATITTASLNNPRTYTLPNLSGEICLSSGNCSGSGGSLTGSGTTNYIPRFTSASGIGDSSIYDDGKVAIGTASPQGLFNVIGTSTGKGLVILNETGNQDILAGSSSGTTRFVFDSSGNLNITGSGYQIGGVNVLSSTGLGSTVVSSSLTSVSTLDSGAISAGFGAIDTGTDAISGGNLTGTGVTGLTLTGNGAGIVFSGTGTHAITASSGTMQLGALTLTGAVTGNGQNVTGLNNLSASGTIQFGGLGIGVVQSNGSGDISSAALNIGGGASYISGTLPTTNGGTGLTSYAAGDLIYASGANTLANRTIGTDGQVLTVSGGVPSWTDVSGSINFWQNINNAISPINSQNDVLIGSNATASAKFAFKNVASGTPTASISAGTNGGVYLTAGGTLATTAKQSITLGSADSGNIVLNGFGTGIVKSNAAGVLSSSAINLAGTDVTGLLGVANGGTGASDASGARTNLGAAASGANADITSLSGLSTALSVGQGGTGTTTLTSNGVLYGNGSGAIGATVAGTTGQLLLGQTGSAPSFQTLGGDATINASGVLAIGTDAVALGGDTTGNFVSNISGGSGIGISGSAGEGWTPTVALAALTGDWDQTGAFDIVLNNAGSELRILESTGGSFYGTIDVGDLSGNQTYSFPATGGTICIVEAANCTGGGGGGVSTAGGTTNRLTRFTGATAIGDASIDDLYTSGVAMTLDASGRVGIGTASPLAQLHVNGIATGGNAAVIFNQTAANDIIAASASGVTRFVVTNNGNIQFGGNTSFLNTLTSLATQNQTYTLPDASGTICLTTGNCAGSGGGLTGSGTVGQIAYFNGAGTLTSDTTGFSWDGTNDRLGIGTDSPVAKLDLNGAVAGKALAIFNQTGDQDIFSASASGTTRLTLTNAGNLNLTSGSYQIGGAGVLNSTTLGSSVINSSLQTVGTIGTGTWQATAIGAQYGGTGDNTSGTTGVPYIAAGNWQYETQLSTARGGTSADLSGAAQGAIPYFSATGVMSALAPSTAGYVLTTNGAGQNPSWIATSSLGTNYWDSANGAISPKNAASTDLLLGATATSEAKFAFKNVSGGTPTASISAGLAGALYLTADGTIGTTARQSLVLGTNTTGNIILNPNGNIAIGSTIPGSDKLSVTGNTRVTGDVRSSNGFYQSGATDTIIGNDNGGSNIRFTTATGEKVRIGDSGNVGIGTTNLVGKFNVSGAATGKALTIFDETGDQNIIAGSASGVTRFTVDRSGNVNSIGGGYRINGTTIIDSTANITNVGTINSTYLTTSTNIVNLGASTALQFNGTTIIDASRNLTNVAGVTTNLNPTANNTYSLGASGNQFSNVYGQTVYQNGNQVCDTSGNCAGQTTTYWNQANGALSPKNPSVDLLVGGSTSDSAKFAVLNMASGTPIASLSGTNGGTFLSATGSLQTTSGQTLYLGGGGTGNIVLNSGPGGITIQDGVTLNGNLTQTGVSSFTTGTGLVTLNGNVDATNGLDVTGAALNVGGSNASISLAGAIIGTQLDIDGSITINGNNIGASTGDLTLSALDGNVFIANGNVLNGGGASGTSYNFFANSGETADQAGIQDDNDLYIGGNLEVDGIIYQGDDQVCDTSGNCNGGTNYFQINGDNISPGNAANDTDKLVIGGNTTTTHQFEVNGKQAGQALVSFNETGNQDILTGSASGTTAFTFDRSGNLTLAGDLRIGSIFLNDVGSNNVTSGASLIGTYDEFTNSDGTTIQQVLNDFDNALGAGSSKWSVSGNVIYPSNAGNQVGIGTTTAGDVVSSFYLTRDQAQGALGKSLAILNQTENQDIFTASSAGTTRFTIANNGNLTATGTLTGLTGLSSSGTINLSSVTANRALFSDGSSNVTGSGNSAALLNALTDETGTGVAVFDTSPTFSTSILTGSSTFDLLNTNVSTLNFGGAVTTLTIGATTGTTTIANSIVNLSNGALRTANVERLSNSGVLSNITGFTQSSGTFATTLSTTNTALFSSTTANSDSIALAPNTTSSNAFTGTLTTADLTGNQTYTLPNTSGTICVSGQSCATSGTVGYLTRTGTNLSPATATDTLSIGTTSPLATFDVRGLSGTSPIASFSGQTALAGLLVDNNGLGDIFTASKGGATKFTLLNNGNIRINNLANCTALETDATGLVNCGTDDLGTGGDGSSNWRIVNGAISPNNNTLDLLLGSSSSSSARFAFLNVNPGSGTPTASIAGTANNALYLTGDGTLATTNKQTLSLGTASTGNVSLTGSRLQFTNLTGCDTIDTDANGFLTCGSDAGGAGGAGTVNVQNNGSAIGTVDTIDFSSLFNVTTGPSSTAHVTMANDVLNFSELSDTLALDNNPTSIAVNDYDLTLGTNAGIGGVIVSPNAGGKAALVVNKYGNNDIFTASASGTTRFTIGNNGNLSATGTITGLTGLTSSGTIRFSGLTNAGGVLFTDGSGNVTQTSVGGSNQCLSGGATPSWVACDSASTSYWQLNNGALAAGNNTYDLLIGGTSTDSAKFAVTNIAAGTPTASISATGTGNGITFSGNGIIQSLQNQTLTLGGNTTGNIALTELTTIGSQSNGIQITTQGAISDLDGNISLNDNTDVTGNVDLSGTLTVGGSNEFSVSTTGLITTTTDETINGIDINAGTVSDVDNLTINGGGTLTIGTTALNEITSPTDSGAYLIGVNDEFDNSNSTNVQAVLNDLDAAIGAGASKWTANSNVMYPTTAGAQIVLGGGTTTAHQFEVTGRQTGKTLVSLNETGDQNILTGSASGTTRFTFDRNGGLNLIGGNVQISGMNVIDSSRNLNNIGTIESTYLDASSNIVNLGASTDLQFNGTTVITAALNIQNISGVATDLVPTVNNTYDLGSSARRYAEIHGQTIYQAGNQVCDTSGNCSGLTTTYWDQNNGTLAAKNSTVDLLVGGVSTSSAKFAVLNVAGGTPTASVSAGNAGGAFLTAAGNLATTTNQTLTLGGGNTGNIVINSGTGGITLADNTTLAGTFNQTGAGQVTFSGNVDATSGLDITGASLTVGGANASISTAGVIAGTQLDIDGILRLDTQTLSAQSGDLILSAADSNIFFADGNVLNAGGKTAQAYNFFANNADGADQAGIDSDNDLYIGGSLEVDGIIYQGDNQVCDTSGNCSGLTTTYWNQNNGALSPKNSTVDFLVGGVSSSAAKFAVVGINGSATPYASVSATSNGNGVSIGGDGTIQSFRKNTLSLGGASTGNIVIDSGSDNITLSDNTNITGNVDLSGTLAVGGSNDFTVSATGVIATITDETINGIDINAGAVTDVTNLTINGGGTLTIGTTALNETTGPTDSGAYLIGVNDEFDNSNSTTVQGVLNDLDAAVGAGSSKWNSSGNVIYPAAAGRQVGVGTTTAGSIISSFYVTRDLTQGALGKATAIINQTENQDIFAASASGTTRVVINNSGYLGLNTATPRSLLDLGTDGGVMTIGGLSSGGQINFGAAGGANSVRFSNNELALYSSQSNGLKFYTNSDSDTATAELTIEDDGDIAFGSTTYANCGMLTTSSNVVTCSSAPTGTNYWQTNSGTLAPGGSASVTDKLVLGGLSTTTSNQFEVNGKQSGKALVSFNETGDQNILVGSASGTTRFAFDRSGNLNLSGGGVQIDGTTVLNASRQFQNVAGVATHLNPTAANTYDLGTGTGDQYREINGQTVYQNGNQVCDVSGNCSGLTTTYWNQNSGALSPKNSTVDFLVGGISSSSAKFAVLGINGSATPYASVSATSNGNGVSIGGDGTIQSFRKNSLSLGGASTGNIVIDSGSGNITLSDNTTLAGTFNQTGAGQVTFSGNVDATSGLDVTGASLTVGGTASISTAGVIAGTQLDIDGILRLDAQTLSAQSGDLTLEAAGNNIVFGTDDTFIIGGHAGNVAYNVMSDAGGAPTSGQITSDDDLYVEGAIEASALYQGANQVCDTSGNCSGLTTTYWNQNNGALSPKNSTVDFLVGGVSSSSAKFSVIGVNSGTPTASVSAGNAGGAFLTAAGNLATTTNQTLTLGGGNTGNIVINSGTGGITLADNTTLAGTFNQTGAGQVTFSGNVDATSGLDVTGASLTVGGTASISTAGVIAGTQLDIDGILRLDTQTLSAQSGDLILSAADNNIVFGDTDTLIIGNHAGNVAYNVMSDAGGAPTSGAINSDDDLYVEGAIEAGAIYQGSNQVCDTSGNCSGLTTTYWNQNNGALSPKNSTVDLLVGGISSSAAKFAVVGINGSATPYASVSAIANGNGISIGGDGTIQSFRKNTLSLGGASTGNIVIDSGSGNITLSDNTTLAGTFNQTGAGQVSLSGNVDATSGLDVTGASLTVGGANASISIAGAIVGTQLDIDGVLRLDGQILSAQSGDLTLSAADNNIVFGDTDTLIIGGHAGNVAYNVISDSGSTSQSLNSDDDLFVEGAVEVDGTLFADGGITLTGGTISDGTDGVDINDSLEIADNTTLGDANTDTITFNAEVAQDSDLVPDTLTGTNDLGSSSVPWDNLYATSITQNGTTLNATFAPIGASYITTASDGTLTGETAIGSLTTGISTTSTLNADGAVTLGGTTIDANQNLILSAGTGKLGVGNASPVGKLDVSGAVTGKALTMLNETGDQNILVGSASGTTRFAFDRSGNLNLSGGGVQIDGTTVLNASRQFQNVAGVATHLNPTAANTYDLGTGTGDQYREINGQTVYQNGNQVCDVSGNCSGLTTTYWNQNSGALSPKNSTVDFLVGGISSSSAKFAVVGVNSGTPTASVSAGNAGGAFLTATGNLATTTNQTLTLGGGNTGNIVINSGAGGITLSDNTTLAGTFNQTGAGQVTFSGNVDATSGLDVTGASLTVGGTATISTGGNISGNQLDIDGTIRLDGTTLSTLSNDLTLDANGGNVVFADADTLIVGGHAGNVGYNVMSDSGGSPTSGAIDSDDDLYVQGAIEASALYQGANQVCDTSGNCAGLTTTYWNQNNGAISAKNATVDLLVGGVSSSAAKFAVLGMNGSATPYASVSAIANGNGISIGGDGVIQSFRKNTLTLGGSSTGNIVIDSGSGNITLSDNTTLAGTFNQTGAGQVTFSGNVDATSGLDVTGASLTVGGTASITTAGAIVGTQLDIDGILRLDSQTLSTLSGDIILDANGNNIAFADADTLIIGGHAGNVAYNVMSDSGGSPTSGQINSDDDLYVQGAIEASALYQGANQVCDMSNNCSSLATNYWNQNNGAISAKNSTVDLLVGGVSSSAAKFAVVGINGSATPYASVSAIANGNGISMGGDGTIQSFRKNTLTLGGASTGNIAISPNGGSGTLTVNAPTLNLNGTTSITGGSTGISFTNFTVNSSTGAVNISGAGGTLTVEGTVLDTDSLTFTGTGLIATQGSTNLTLAPATGYVRVGDTATPGSANGDDDLFVEGDVELNGILYADSNVQIGGTTITASSLTTMSTAALSINATGDLTLDSTTDIILDADGADIFLRDAGAAFAQFTNSTTDLTLDVAGGQFILANADTLNIGGLTGVAYNAISDSGATNRGLASDNDLFVEGDVEVNGTMYLDAGISVNGVAGVDVTASCVTTDNGIVTGSATCEPGADSWTANSALGVLTTSNQTMDVLIGGTSTASAALRLTANNRGPVASIAAKTGFAAMVVNNNSTGDLFTASKSGKTHFTIRNSGAVVIGNTTDGITFDVNNPNVVYSGNARPSKKLVISPEYSGAILTASTSASGTNTGYMTSDASSSAAFYSATHSNQNYYEWSTDSTQGTLQDYIIAVRVTLPHDFGGWQTSNAITLGYNTELGANGSNKLDIKMLNATAGISQSESVTPIVFQRDKSTSSKTWTDFVIDDSDLTDGASNIAWDNAGETAVIYLRMYSRHANHIQIGDITLNYLGRN